MQPAIGAVKTMKQAFKYIVKVVSDISENTVTFLIVA
jgi:hypothetical protein